VRPPCVDPFQRPTTLCENLFVSVTFLTLWRCWLGNRKATRAVKTPASKSLSQQLM